MKVAVIQFPGSNCDYDVAHVLRNVIGMDCDLVWHKEFNENPYDAIILPGGFSYGDYLRAGVIAAHSDVMRQVQKAAVKGKPVLGICNGFQILVEAGLLPGALLPNDCLRFVCKWVTVRVETSRTAFTNIIPRGSLLKMPIAHQEGRYFIDESSLARFEENEQVVFRYVNSNGEPTAEANPNGSVGNVAGVCNEEGNVVALMPHPERASEKVLSPFGTDDGLLLFKSMVRWLECQS